MKLLIFTIGIYLQMITGLPVVRYEAPKLIQKVDRNEIKAFLKRRNRRKK